MTTLTPLRQSSAFPTVAILRKGGPKKKIQRDDGRIVEAFGDDLIDCFRVDFLPGVDPALKDTFESMYPERLDKTWTVVTRLQCMIPFRSVWECFSTSNVAYQGHLRFAEAVGDNFMKLRHPFTHEWIVRNGEPPRPYIPDEPLLFEHSGKQYAFRLKPATRLRMLLPQLVGHMVTFEFRTTAFYDAVNLRNNLAAIQSAADALGSRSGAACIPLVLYRAETLVDWNDHGKVKRVRKSLVYIKPDPESAWAKTYAGRLAAMAMETSPAGEINPDEDRDYFANEEGNDDENGDEPALTPVPDAVMNAPEETHTTASPAQQDILAPEKPNDWTTFWNKTVPALGISREAALEALKQADNNAVVAYQCLAARQG